ncbi:MAG TPA: MraY family glycosyltransferase [Bryobacteraceae bacterium]|nr:MraY family glycosyltransferase [Bryobacteraceae bacterium]
MHSLLWLGFRAFIISLVLTPICRDVFRSYGVVDRPDAARKVHRYPIPRVGGLAIAIAYLVAYVLVRPEEGSPLARQLSLVWKLLPGAALAFAVGLLDDLFNLRAWIKLGGQVAAAALACAGGVRILSIGGAATDGWWNIPLTILWLLACMNAFNLVDGLDGLAAGVGLFATLTVFAASMMQHNMVLAVATFPLAGALLAFLVYNFNPATIFLGDSGSLLIGFLLGCYAAIWSNKSATLLGMTAPLIALSVPLLDVALAIVRRFLRRQPIFAADRGHIHHRLLDRGLTPRRVVLVLYGLCGLAAAFSLLQGVVHSYSGALLLVFGLFVLLGIQYLGYAEFDLAGRLLFSGEFQRSVSAQLDLQKFHTALSAAITPAACWEALREACPKFGFQQARLCLAGEIFEYFCDESGSPGWSIRVPLANGDSALLVRPFASPVLPTVVAPFVDLLRETLLAKFPEIALHEAGGPAAVSLAEQ